MDILAGEDEGVGAWVAVGYPVTDAGDTLDRRQSDQTVDMVTAAVDRAKAPVHRYHRPDIGVTADTELQLVPILGFQGDADRHLMVVTGLIELGLDGDPGEVLGAEQVTLQQQQGLRRVDIARLYMDILVEKILIEDILLEAQVTNVILGTGVDLQLDLGLIASGYNPQLMDQGLGLRIAQTADHLQ